MTNTPTIATKLMKVFTGVGIPREILVDWGSNFTSRLMQELHELLKVKSLKTSVYHQQTDGLVEWFKRTMKMVLKKFAVSNLCHWDRMLPLYGRSLKPPQGFCHLSCCMGDHTRGFWASFGYPSPGCRSC